MKRSFTQAKITLNKSRVFEWYKTKNQEVKSVERHRSAKHYCEYNKIIATNVCNVCNVCKFLLVSSVCWKFIILYNTKLVLADTQNY